MTDPPGGRRESNGAFPSESVTPGQEHPAGSHEARPSEATGPGAPAVDLRPKTLDELLAEAGPDAKLPEPVDVGQRRRVIIAHILKWTKRVAITLVALAAIAALSVWLTVRHYESGLPSVEQLKTGYTPPQVTRVLARDGSVLASVFTERRTVIPFNEVPDHAKLAFLAAEDASFYEHEGLDYFGMLRAMLANIRAGRTVQGGSTITQQVVKNVLLDSERSYRRKIRETILARRLEQSLSKDEILGLYLNHIYLGHGRYGIEEASRYYFGKKAKDLNLAEAATLAGLVASPERFSPRKSAEKALERRHYVLGQMLQKGFITQELHDQALDAALRVAPAAEGESELAPEVVTYVSKLLENVVGERARRGGYVVSTSIDPALQAEARRTLRKNLDGYATRQKLEPPFTLTKRKVFGVPFEGTPRPHHAFTGVVTKVDDGAKIIEVKIGTVTGRVNLAHEDRYNPKHLPPSDFTKLGAVLRISVPALPEGNEVVPARLELGPEGALVAIDPRTRQVLALVGSYEALAGGLDRATRARRQPGSSFKPFVYSYALHARRHTPATMLDLPASRDKKLEARTLSVRSAITKSDNAAAERLLAEVGAANVVEWSKALGIESDLQPTPSLALGAYEVTPLEIANAYATFASGGEFAQAVIVTKIVGPDGAEVALPPALPTRRAMQAEEAYLTTSLLKSVVKDGTGKRASVLGRPLAGKTGTTNEAKDAWFVGYSPDLVAATWIGFDDAIPLGWGESGSTTAVPGWVDFMKVALEKRPKSDFPRPPGILVVSIDPLTGLLARADQEDAIEEEFLDGTAPTETASLDAGVEGGVEEASDAGAPVDPEAVQAGSLPTGPVPVAPEELRDAGASGAPPNEDLPPF
jgi:penicillin-binding protein 1A